MKISKSIILMACFCMLVFTACGERTYPEGQEVTDELATTVSSISIEKDGKISSTIIENFAESYYDESELKEMIVSSIDTYQSTDASAQIQLKSFKVKDNMTNILIEFGNYQAYAGYNKEDFFAGTIKDANMAGFDLNVTLNSVLDSSVVSKPELLGMGESHIIIVGNEEEPEAGQEAEQLRINCFGEILYISEGVTTVGKKSADVSLSKGYKMIVFK